MKNSFTWTLFGAVLVLFLVPALTQCKSKFETQKGFVPEIIEKNLLEQENPQDEVGSEEALSKKPVFKLRKSYTQRFEAGQRVFHLVANPLRCSSVEYPYLSEREKQFPPAVILDCGRELDAMLDTLQEECLIKDIEMQSSATFGYRYWGNGSWSADNGASLTTSMFVVVEYCGENMHEM